jgi:hypothetical protein
MLSDQPGLLDTDENTQPLAEDDETAKPTLKEPPNPVPRTTTAWQQYYDTMGVARQKVIEKLAKQQEYEITLVPEYDLVDRNKLITPDEKITLRRRKISTRDFFEIERRRAAIQNLKSSDKLELAKILLDLYEGMAYIYLEDKATGHVITKAQFERIHWPVTKAILDACNLSSVAGQVPLDEKI